MRAGSLTEIIEIWKPVTVINEFGEQATEYILSKQTRANLIHNSGNRNINNGEVVFSYNKTFVIRNYHNIDELDRIKWNNRFYRILDIEPNDKLQQLTLVTDIINE
jgi:head-tail adaptor